MKRLLVERDLGEALQVNRRRFIQTAACMGAMVLVPALRAGEGGAVLDLNPGPGNPRNSEGAFVTLESGRILFLYTRFHGGTDDASPADIVCIHSDDEGATWTRDHRVVVENNAGANVMSVSLLRLKSGALALFYLVKNSLVDCRPVVRLSTDQGETWSSPINITSAPGYFVLNNDRVIQLGTGRLIVPLAFHRARGSNPKSFSSWDRRAIAMWFLSDDEGKTWHEAEDWWALPARTRSGLQEPGVVELADSRIFSWMRTDQGVQFGCYSSDAGSTWSRPERTSMYSPESPASIKRIPQDHKLLAVYNDHSGQFAFSRGKRSPLVSAISEDGGKTWMQRRKLESDPSGWYCYTAMHFTGEHVLLGYCAGDSKIGGLNRLRLRRVRLSELYQAGS